MLCGLALLNGCDSGMAADASDAAMDGSLTPDIVDVPVDRGDTPDVQRPPYGRCATTADCAVGLMCDLAYAGGMCRLTRCTSDRNCGTAGICTGSGGCRPSCMAGANDCAAWAGLCFFFDSTAPDRRACYASCYDPPTPDYPACVAPRMCDLHGGGCVTALPTMGGDVGAPCLTNADCRSGRCSEETSATPTPDTPTGNLDGYCIAVARRPAQDAYMPGMPMPRGNCPMGSVPIPFTGAMEGDGAVCYRECRMDSDCRAGYFCNRVFNMTYPMGAYTNGGCFPIDCSTMGRTCPAGFHCSPRGTPPRGYCQRDAPGDGGVSDGGSDAATRDAMPPADSGAAPDVAADIVTDTATGG